MPLSVSTYQAVTRPMRSLKRGCAAFLDRFSRDLLCRSYFGSALYDLFIQKRMLRETRAVLHGLQRHAESSLDFPGSALFRRNIHRLEKGLILANSRRAFGQDFIRETVDLYRAAARNRTLAENGELHWATDVLNQYFIVHPVGSVNTEFELLRDAFRRFNEWDSMHKAVRVPRPKTNQPNPVSYESLLELCKRRRSVRHFSTKKVPRELIDKALQAATLAPSACNRQPFVFRIADSSSTVARLARLPMGTAGFAENIPVFIAIVGQLRCFSEARDRHLIYIDGSLAAMNFALALETLGLSSCFLNWPDIEERERALSHELQLATDERAIVCMAVGFAAENAVVAHSERKPLNLIRRYESEC